MADTVEFLVGNTYCTLIVPMQSSIETASAVDYRQEMWLSVVLYQYATNKGKISLADYIQVTLFFGTF